MKKSRKIIGIVAASILGIIVVFMMGILISNSIALSKNQMTSFFGYSISYVPTDSMEPTIESGDTVLIKKCDFDDVKIGDIIVYKNDNKYIIHRVVRFDDDGSIVTKGDNDYTNPVEDDVRITRENFYGKYKKTVNYLNFSSIVKNRNYILPICILVFVGIIISEAISIAKTISEKNKKKIEELKETQMQALKEKMKEEMREELEEKIKEEMKK